MLLGMYTHTHIGPAPKEEGQRRFPRPICRKYKREPIPFLPSLILFYSGGASFVAFWVFCFCFLAVVLIGSKW